MNLKKALLKAIEILDFCNIVFDKLQSAISNSHVGNFVKEILGIGVNYQTYLYCPETRQWVVSLEKKKISLWRTEVSGLLSENFNYAHNFQGISYFRKRSLVKDVIRANDGKVFVWKHIISY